MKQPRFLVVDANIIIRSVLGQRVRNLIESCPATIAFAASRLAVEEAFRYGPPVGSMRGLGATDTGQALRTMLHLIGVVDHSSYVHLEHAAKARIAHRDPKDWPIVATALLLDAPIWTEDQDFFGCGVATWVTATVGLHTQV